MRFACWVTKTIDTHSEYVILIAFHGYKGYTQAPNSTLPVLFDIVASEVRDSKFVTAMKTKGAEVLSSKEGIRKICVFRNMARFASLKR
jgi:hypothetical protein